jgi:hypothetical protein
LGNVVLVNDAPKLVKSCHRIIHGRLAQYPACESIMPQPNRFPVTLDDLGLPLRVTRGNAKAHGIGANVNRPDEITIRQLIHHMSIQDISNIECFTCQ